MRKSKNRTVPAGIRLVVVAGAVLGTLGMVDYYGAGVLTVFIFYFFHGHGRKWWCLLGQLVALYWVTWSCWAGLCTPFSSSAWTLSFASRGWRCWHWCAVGVVVCCSAASCASGWPGGWCGRQLEGSKLQFSLEPLSQPAALLSGETVLWYNAQFRTRC